MSDTSLIFNLLAVDKASEKILGVKSAFGLLAVGVAASAAVFVEKSIKMAGDFESSTQKIASSGGEVQDNLGKVRKGLLDLGPQVGYTGMQLSDAFYKASSATFNYANGGLTVVKAAAQGAKAEQADLVTVTDAVSSALLDYHKGAGDAAQVTSYLVGATSAGKMTFEELAGSLHSVLPNASQAHIGLTDILGDLAAMTVHGESADQAAQNLNDVINHMQHPTSVQAHELALLGMTTNQLSDDLKSKGLSGTLQEIANKIGALSPPGTTKVVADLGTALNGLSPAVRDLGLKLLNGSDTLKQYKTEAKNLTPIQAEQALSFATLAGSTHRIGDAQMSGAQVMQTYGGALAAATGDATGLNVALMLSGENTKTVNDAISTVNGSTVEAGGNVKGWSAIQSTFNQQLSEFKAYLNSATIEIGTKLLPVAKDALKWSTDSVQWLGKHKDVTQVLAGVLGGLTAVLVTYKLGVMAANVAMKAATVGKAAWTVVTGAARLAMLAWTGAQALANSTLGTWIGVQAIDFAAWVRKAITVTGNTVALAAHAVAVGAVRLATLAWVGVQWALNVAMDANPIGLIVIGIAALVAAILYLWFHSSAFRKFLIEMWGDIWGFLKAVGHWFANDFANFFVAGYHWVINAATDAHDWVMGKWNALIGFVVSVPGKLANAGRGMFDWARDEFRGAINWIIGGWNKLHFSVPGFSVFGQNVGGFDLGLPQIPYLEAGGIVTRGGLAKVGERGAETVALPAGAAVYPHGSTPSGSGGKDVVYLRAGDPFGEWLIEELRRQIGKRGGKTTLVLDS